MKINKYFPFVFVYFFINSVALPFGLTYTALLAPLFYTWIILKTKREILFPFLALLTPFIIIQLMDEEINRRIYFTSLLNLMLVYIFCHAVYLFLKVCRDPERIFRLILYINFILCIIAAGIFFTSYRPLMWMEQNLTEGVKNFSRMKLFTYEPSYYATLFVPVFCFYFLQFLFRQNKIPGGILLGMLFLPFLLSFSFGVMAVLAAAAILTYLVHFRVLTRKKRIFKILLASVFLILILFPAIYFLFPDSFLVVRIENIFTGEDTSGKGRTSDAFYLANSLLQNHNEYWGIGPGQIKIMGEAILRKYYMYQGNFTPAIPNAAAETLTIFGWTGFMLRIVVEIVLFLYTQVWKNYYRLWLFLFIFMYQFTGSFITNLAEYVIWILAFTQVFRQFDLSPLRRQPIYTASATFGGMIKSV